MTASDAPREFELAPAEATQTLPLTKPDRQISAAASEPVRTERLISLDVFRGITIAAMLLVNHPGDWSNKYAPLGHVEWNGWTPTDLIFPFFLFIVGVAIPFSFAKRSLSESRREMLLHIWSRALSLVLLGLLLNSVPSRGVEPLRPEGFTLLGILRMATFVIVPLGFIALLFPWRSRRLSLLLPPIVAVVLLGLGFAIYFATRSASAAGLPASFDLGNGLFRPSQLRFPGVLQRIGVCYGVAATIVLFAGWRTVLFAFLVLCTVYSALMLREPLTREDNLARQIDVAVFDRPGAKHTYDKYPDPEGLLSTLPAIGSVLIGVLVGYSLRAPNRANGDKCAKLLANGVFVTIAGVLLGWWLMPINKMIWTPSFTVFTAGMGMLTLGAVFYVTDVKYRRAWAWPFKVFGMNAIAAFVLAGLVVRVAPLIKINDPWTGSRRDVLGFCKARVNDAVHHAGDWWSKTLPALPPLDTPANASLAYAIAFVLVILVVMSVFYVFRIFLKV
jgi:predicted acyltransferase